MDQAAGFASLTITVVALLIIWTGLIRRDRMAWVVQFLIVFMWVLPVYVWESLSKPWTYTAIELFKMALHGSAIGRIVLGDITMFSLMVIALGLAAKPVFRSRGSVIDR
jgi:hypothetical protein